MSQDTITEIIVAQSFVLHVVGNRSSEWCHQVFKVLKIKQRIKEL